MADEAKKGILSRLFGLKSSGCCNAIRIEEVSEEQPESDDKKNNKNEQTSKKTFKK